MNHPQARGPLGLPNPWLKRGFGVGCWSSEPNVASGSPVPRRRTFASAFHGRRSLDAACAPPSMAPLAGNAVSRSTGDPSLAAPSVARRASFNRVGEAGIGERSRSEEVPPTNDETFAGPADVPPTGRPPRKPSQESHPKKAIPRKPSQESHPWNAIQRKPSLPAPHAAARACFAGRFVTLPCSTWRIESASSSVLARCVIMITVRFST